MCNASLTPLGVLVGRVEGCPPPTAVVIALALVVANGRVASVAVVGVAWVVTRCVVHADHPIGYYVQRLARTSAHAHTRAHGPAANSERNRQSGPPKGGYVSMSYGGGKDLVFAVAVVVITLNVVLWVGGFTPLL